MILALLDLVLRHLVTTTPPMPDDLKAAAVLAGKERYIALQRFLGTQAFVPRRRTAKVASRIAEMVPELSLSVQAEDPNSPSDET
jgi:hypothetical protein